MLLAALRQAASDGFKVHTWQLAWALTWFFYRHAHWHDATTSDMTALKAAEDLGDVHAQALIHCCFPYAYIPLGQHDDAHSHLVLAFRIFEDLGDPMGQAHAHRILAWLLGGRDRYREALQHAQQAVELFRIAGHEIAMARALNVAGWFHIQLGDLEAGLALCQRALDARAAR